jgi:tetratricopeptide (TPR) repeat protein
MAGMEVEEYQVREEPQLMAPRTLAPRSLEDLTAANPQDCGLRKRNVVMASRCYGTLMALMVLTPAALGQPAEIWLGQIVMQKQPPAIQGPGASARATADERLRYWPVHSVIADEGDSVRVQTIAYKGHFAKRDLVLLKDAPAFFSDRIRAEPAVAAHYFHRGLALMVLEQFDAAIDDFTKAITMDADRPFFFIERGSAFVQKKQFDKALADFQEALRLDPGNIAALSGRGGMWHHKGDVDKAMADYDAAIRLVPNFALGYFHRAKVWSFKNDYAKAVFEVDAAIRIAPDFEEAYMLRGKLLFLTNNYRKAITDFDQVVGSNPTKVDAFILRALNRISLKEYEQGIDDLNRAIRLAPKEGYAYFLRGGAWCAQKQYEKGIADLTKAIEISPDHISAYSYRGYAWAQIKEYGKALADYAEGLKRAPNHDEILGNRAWLLATCPDDRYRDGRRALDDAKRSCELTRWKDAGHLGTLAAAYAECGQFEEAITWQRKALEDASYAKEYGDDARKRLALYKLGKPYRQDPAK